jgi:hypothetical protein
MTPHPDDLQYLNRDLHQPQGQSPNDGGMVLAFSRTCRSLEPAIVFPNEETRREWLSLVAEVEFKIGAWQRRYTVPEPAVHQIKPGTFTRLAEFAAAHWRAPTTMPLRQMPFIRDAALRKIAERDFVSLLNARKSDDVKAALVFAGSLVETILLDQLERDRARATACGRAIQTARRATNARVWGRFDPVDIDTWNLVHMVAVVGPDGLGALDRRTEQMADTVRDWRNFIHPRKERDETQAAPLRIQDSVMAAALAEVIVTQLEAFP